MSFLFAVFNINECGGTAVPSEIVMASFVPLFENLWIDLERLNYRLLVSYTHKPELPNFKLVDHIF